MNLFSTSSNISGDVCSTLFGSTSILTLSSFDVWMCVILSVIVVLFFVLFYNRIFSVTFDENFAKATGQRAGLYNLLIAIVIAVIIVVSMQLVGSLLISSQVLIAEAARELYISVKARQHQQLLIYLRRLRQSVKLAVMYTRGHEVVSRTV